MAYSIILRVPPGWGPAAEGAGGAVVAGGGAALVLGTAGVVAGGDLFFGHLFFVFRRERDINEQDGFIDSLEVHGGMH